MSLVGSILEMEVTLTRGSPAENALQSHQDSPQGQVVAGKGSSLSPS